MRKLDTWLPVAGLDGRYVVSSTGIVKSVFSITKTGKKRMLGKVLQQTINDRGYLTVKIAGKTRKVHRLVALSFIDNPENKQQVNHKDLNPLNNHVNNLEWATPKENTNHAQQNGRMPIAKPVSMVGEYPRRYKKVINRRSGHVCSTKELAISLGVSVKYVARRLSGERPWNMPYSYVQGEYSYEYN